MSDYFVGLDMGTNSVGWAVTDTHYHLLRRKGKDLWGIRLFDRADTAVDRRSYRVSRRRLARKKARIGWLKELFRPYLDVVDPGFLQRLEDSKFYVEDKTVLQKFTLFSDGCFTDVDYYNRYPTIFHLRNELVNSDAEHDVRLVFLAILNMYQHRGHFLNPELQEGTIGNLDDLLSQFANCIQNLYPYANWDVTVNIEAQKQIFLDKTLSSTKRYMRLLDSIGVSAKDKSAVSLIEMYKLICGLKASLSLIFSFAELSEDLVAKKFSFSDSTVETIEADLEQELGSDGYDLYCVMKQIHAWYLLAEIMCDENGQPYDCISASRVALYDRYNQQLGLLKRVYKKYLPGEYDAMFRVASNNHIEDNSYSAYSGSVNSCGRKIRREGKSASFLKNVKDTVQKLLIQYPDDVDLLEIMKDIDAGQFLVKQRSVVNGSIPNQIYVYELRRILNNASTYLSFLNDVDETGLTNSEKIIEMFRFNIPYYVGPLKNTTDNHGWVVRKESGKVYPWNLEDKVDIVATRDQFIWNLIRKCTYLNDEKVLPASSLLYEKYKVLNELNNLCIYDQPISVELKQEIYCDLFRRRGKQVTTKQLLDYLHKRALIGQDAGEDCLSGYDKHDGKFHNKLSSYHIFCEVFDTDVLTDAQEKLAEDVIYYATIYGDDKAFFTSFLMERFSDLLTSGQIKRLSGIRFRDWGKLSKAFLRLQGVDRETGECMSLISRMWNTNDNLMQILDSTKYTYCDVVEQKAKRVQKCLTDVTYDDIADSYLSAPVRRMVWQSIRIVQEIVEIMGSEPKHIFIEMTRYDDVKGDAGRKFSRKAQLLALYKKCAIDDPDLLSGLDACDERDLRVKKLYLYYRQQGKSMYSGKPIDLSQLFDDGVYDIDHIYPRHYLKDDNIENNLVLVESSLNRIKSDGLVPSDIQNNMRSFWTILHKEGFINDEKFKRLTRVGFFSDEELGQFIARQLVETSQGTKAVADILNFVFGNMDSNAKVVYVKAQNVSEFRNSNKQYPEFVKCRVINDYHHAKDAYLNIVVGNVYYTKFTLCPINFLKTNDGRSDHYNLNKMFDWQVERSGYVAWNPSVDFETVRSTMCKNSVLVTRRSYVAHGQISKATLLSAKDVSAHMNSVHLPLKQDNVLGSSEGMLKYGAYGDVQGAAFFLVEHGEETKRVRFLEPIYVYMLNTCNTIEALESYCSDVLGYKNPSVRLVQIPMYSHLRINGFDYYLSGRSGIRLCLHSAVQFVLSCEWVPYVRMMQRAIDENWSDKYFSQQIVSLYHSNTLDSLSFARMCNEKLYDIVRDRVRNSLYQRMCFKLADKFVDDSDATRWFKNDMTSIMDQNVMLMSIFKYIQGSSGVLDLGIVQYVDSNGEQLNLPNSAGALRINKNISKCNECVLLQDSITGVYQHAVDLLTV